MKLLGEALDIAKCAFESEFKDIKNKIADLESYRSYLQFQVEQQDNLIDEQEALLDKINLALVDIEEKISERDDL